MKTAQMTLFSILTGGMFALQAGQSAGVWVVAENGFYSHQPAKRYDGKLFKDTGGRVAVGAQCYGHPIAEASAGYWVRVVDDIYAVCREKHKGARQ